jgi:hypothetical protein
MEAAKAQTWAVEPQERETYRDNSLVIWILKLLVKGSGPILTGVSTDFNKPSTPLNK